jgi:general secretion pathway protein D
MEGTINKNSEKICVLGGQGSPQWPDEASSPVETPGSSMNRRALGLSIAMFRVAPFALLAVFAFSSVVLLAADSAKTFFKRGQSAEAREDYDAAFDNYQKAAAKAPKDLEFRTALYRVRVSASSLHMAKGHKLLDAGDPQGALAEFLHAAEIDPGNEAAQQAIAKVRQKQGEAVVEAETSLGEAEGVRAEIDSMGAPITLRPVSNEPLTLHAAEDSKVIYQAVGKAAGVNILFDPEYTSKRIQVDLNNVSLLDGLRIIGTLSNTFWKPVTENTIFVAQNNRTKHTELDEQAVQTFYLSNAWQANDVTDVQQAIRQVMPSAKVFAVPTQNAIVIRGTPDELMLAEKLVNDLDKARPEVVVDIAVLEVSKNWERTLGIAWPSSVGVTLQPSCATTGTCSSSSSSSSSSSTTTSPTLYDLAHLKATDFAVTVGSATANLLLTDSNTRILQNPRIRATDAQKATMKIGSKIPIATGSFQSGVGSVGAGVSPLAETQFQYQDVGVNIEMTPTVHFDRDVTLKVKIEVSAQSGSVTISGVTEPIISQRVVDQTIRLREGEASILGGIQDKQVTESWNGIPGLSSIPIIKYLFGSKDHTIADDELVFLVVPHVVRSQSLEASNLRTIDTGVGTTAVEIRHNSGATPAPAAATPIQRPHASMQPPTGTVPGQSAMAAGPAALAQMREAADAVNSPRAVMARIAPATAAGPPPVPVPSAGVPVSLMLPPMPGPVAAGATFKVPVVLNGGTDIASVPMQITYDPDKLTLVNVDSGDFLGRDGQAVALVHRDEGPGQITINASRPPGAAGMTGSGVVCILSFQAKTAGASAIAVTRPGAVTSTQQQLPAQGGRVDVQVQ